MFCRTVVVHIQVRIHAVFECTRAHPTALHTTFSLSQNITIHDQSNDATACQTYTQTELRSFLFCDVLIQITLLLKQRCSIKRRLSCTDRLQLLKGVHFKTEDNDNDHQCFCDFCLKVHPSIQCTC